MNTDARVGRDRSIGTVGGRVGGGSRLCVALPLLARSRPRRGMRAAIGHPSFWLTGVGVVVLASAILVGCGPGQLKEPWRSQVEQERMQMTGGAMNTRGFGGGVGGMPVGGFGNNGGGAYAPGFGGYGGGNWGGAPTWGGYGYRLSDTHVALPEPRLPALPKLPKLNDASIVADLDPAARLEERRVELITTLEQNWDADCGCALTRERRVELLAELAQAYPQDAQRLELQDAQRLELQDAQRLELQDAQRLR